MNTEDPDYNNYVGLRHLHPELIREMRFGLDNGVTAAPLLRKLKRERSKQAADEIALRLIDLTEGAVLFMVRNPDAGIIRWTEGEQYVFVETEKP